MNCPSCKSAHNRTLETIRVSEGLRRHRLCSACGHKFSTLERIEVYDRVLKAYAPPGLRAVPDAPATEPPAVKPKAKPAAARYTASLGDDRLAAIADQAKPLLVQWWNEARWSKHKGKATWTEAAWDASVRRIAALSEAEQIELAKAGIENGWQALKPEYVWGRSTVRSDMPRALPRGDGRPMPTDPNMLAALESWPA